MIHNVMMPSLLYLRRQLLGNLYGPGSVFGMHVVVEVGYGAMHGVGATGSAGPRVRVSWGR